MDDGRRRFCPDCGAELRFELEVGHRYPWCAACGFVRYRNPIVGVAVVVRDAAGRVLLGRRAKGEYAGLWCIPCGYVEWDEDVRAAAEREFAEETGLRVRAGRPLAVYSNFHNPKQHTVGNWFEGEVLGGELAPLDGELEALDWFDPAAPPELAFPTDARVISELPGVEA
ncbi:MAG: NUDIX hydrolase [Dehalococcoidia bacterium]|nr:NUDIX hydrolase [Dehalococcoidia bacterium]